MDADRPDLTFAPVTREQARLFAAIARMLDRRGVVCRFGAPSPEVAEALLDEWGPRVAVAPRPDGAGTAPDAVPDEIGAYDAWRHGWSDTRRRAAASATLGFWRGALAGPRPRAVVVWNGRDDVFVESAVRASRELELGLICLELGPLRRMPMTVAVSRNGINAAAQFRRPEKLDEPLVPWEAARLDAARDRFRTGIRPQREAGPYAFLPLQVDDDTQLYYYAPHFPDQRAMVEAVVAAMPAGLRLLIKPHPLCDPRFGRSHYAPLLREPDGIAAPRCNTLGLIAGSALVLTTNSSAGIEALMLDRPVVVLGEAHYRGRGFTHDHAGGEGLDRLIAAAAGGPQRAEALRRRDRYLYELLFHELVPLERHPLREALGEEDADSLAVRIWDRVEPQRLGSDWQPLFSEIRALRGRLDAAVEQALGAIGPDVLLVASRGAASCLGRRPGAAFAVLEDLPEPADERVAGRSVSLLAPDLSPGQCAAVAERLRRAGARAVQNLMHRLSRRPCGFHVDRFNRLPRAMRDELVRRGDYWDDYLRQSGIGPENTPAKEAQAAAIVEAVRPGAGTSLIEYGCGDGRILQRLALAGDRPWKTLVGVDSSERMLELARERLKDARGVRLIPADARAALPLADESFDTVLTCGALQHVHAADLPAVLRRLLRLPARCAVHWETFEAFRPSAGGHYTNPNTSRAIHEAAFERWGPVALSVRDARPINGQAALLARYDLDRPLLTVLTLHAIGRPPPDCAPLDYRNMFLAADRFEALLDGLADAEYRFLDPREALAEPRGAARLPQKAIVLTFDDGYASVFEVARPLLDRRGIRAAVFIPTRTLGRPFGGNTRRGGGPALPTMTTDRLRALCDAGWIVGSHSVSHRAFAGLSDADARRELAESRACLESLLGRRVSLFAFPYGEPDVAYRRMHIDMAIEAGYERVLTMRPGFVPAGHAAVDWPRVGIGADTTADTLLEDLAALHRRTSGWPRPADEDDPPLEQRVRGAVRRCVADGVERIALYGAGRHTARLVETASLWPLNVLGIIDDDDSLRGAQRHGLPVYASADIADLGLDAVLISSDRYEEAIYRRIAPLEARGIRVLRLYAGGPDPRA